MRKLVVSMSVGVLVALATPAFAQAVDGSSAVAFASNPASPASSSGFRLTRGLSFVPDDDSPAAPASSSSEKKAMVFVEGGVLHASDITPFLVGGGVTFLPRPELGILADFMYGHGSEQGFGINFIVFSFDAVYRAQIGPGTVVPIVGGGVVIVRASAEGQSESHTRFQLLFGAAFKVGNGHEFTAEMRVIFVPAADNGGTAGSNLVFLGGFAF